jgi:hypothetical protein
MRNCVVYMAEADEAAHSKDKRQLRLPFLAPNRNLTRTYYTTCPEPRRSAEEYPCKGSGLSQERVRFYSRECVVEQC